MSMWEVRIMESKMKWLECAQKIVKIAKESLVDCYGNNVFEGALIDEENNLRIYHDNATIEHIENFKKETKYVFDNLGIFFPFFAIKQDDIMSVMKIK